MQRLINMLTVELLRYCSIVYVLNPLFSLNLTVVFFWSLIYMKIDVFAVFS